MSILFLVLPASLFLASNSAEGAGIKTNTSSNETREPPMSLTIIKYQNK
ncbi:hypothetical protein G3A_14380 [Bacillus sp. 17376]|nr:hypothetical protein G3A_14380 [Bacillus sp. 17376]